MRAEIQRRWVEALRSGEYVQGQLQMRTEPGAGEVKHCCLGVLTELWCKDTGEKWPYTIAGTSVVEQAVMEWAGVGGERNCFLVLDRENSTSLARLNDGNEEMARTFEEIAGLIEEHGVVGTKW